MRFGPDWPGVFIRGDNAAAIAGELVALIGEPQDDADPNTLAGLLVLLRTAGGSDVQPLRPFTECRETT
jgi:hypothetical protein